MKEQIDPREKYSSDVIEYFYNQKLDRYLEFDEHILTYDPNYLQNADEKPPLDPILNDLVRLHKLVRQRKVFTILEFGTGYSTIIMSDAISKNKSDFEDLKQKPEIRNTTPFQIFTVDASSKWIEHTKEIFPKNLINFVSFSLSDVHIDTFNGRLCHFYDKLPNIVPDFIYLDGPSPEHVKGSINGLDFQLFDRTVLSADLLLMESTFLPGTYILIDGRTNNARFLKNNFQRTFEYVHNVEEDVHTFELIEKPLGIYNRNSLDYCLGEAYFSKLENLQ